MSTERASQMSTCTRTLTFMAVVLIRSLYLNLVKFISGVMS